MKTIEQAASEYTPKNWSSLGKIADDAFKAGVKFAQQWISVDEELPEKGSRVLLKNENGYIEIRTMGVSSISNGKLRNTIGGHLVAHWRPIEVK